MRVILTETFASALIAAPAEIQKTFGKQLAYLLRDLRHPSLCAKKYDEARDLGSRSAAALVLTVWRKPGRRSPGDCRDQERQLTAAH